MNSIIGIDLGTTYSVIAVYGDVKTKGNYPDAQYISECNVTLIPDPYGSFAIPSAFWSDPNNPDDLKFGTDAKEIAKEGKAPVLFSKRGIGTTVKYEIGEKEYSARDVATQYLKYLKQCAETALGVSISRAVITHPAYFSLNQVEETRQAAIDAGFNMSDGDQMLMEPQAAALSFIASDPRDNITTITYDLGGGTFDVTVVEKKDGIITCKAFDGNPLLGGYNFDRRFVDWLLKRVRDRLEKSGRTFDLDENDTKDQSTMSNLLQYAETIKYDLVKKPTPKVPVAISVKNILFDTEGKPIEIIDRINREEYTALIQDLLDDTIEKTWNAISKSGLSIKDFDSIVLVGGSTYGQWVQETIKKRLDAAIEEWIKDGNPVEELPNIEILQHPTPDLCVAMGAAIAGNELAPDTEPNKGSSYAIEADVPRSTSLEYIHITGTVKNKNGESLEPDLLDSFYLMIEPDDNQIGEVRLNEDSGFIFSDVELLDDEETKLTIRLFDDKAIQLAELPLSIEYKPIGGSGRIESLKTVPKSIFIKTGSGLVTLAKEGDRLPVKSQEVRLRRLYDDPTLNLDVYQEGDWVTTIQVEGIPDDAGEGSKVTLNIEITKKNIMRGKVVVRNLDNKVVTEWPVEIHFPPIYIPTIEELNEKFEEIENKRQEELYNEKDPKRRSKLGKGDKIARDVKKLFTEEGKKETQEIHQKIKELEALFIIEKEKFDPPAEKFDELLQKCEDEIRIKQDAGENQEDNLTKIERIKKGRNDAFLTKDRRKWSYYYGLLERLYQKIIDNGPPPPLPTTEVLKDQLHSIVVEDLYSKLDRKIKDGRAKGVYNDGKHLTRVGKIENTINNMKKDINNIDNNLEPEVALSKLQSIMLKKPSVEDMIERLFDEVVTEGGRRW